MAGMSSFAGGALVGAHAKAGASAPAHVRSITPIATPTPAADVARQRRAPTARGVTAYIQPLRRK